MDGVAGELEDRLVVIILESVRRVLFALLVKVFQLIV